MMDCSVAEVRERTLLQKPDRKLSRDGKRVCQTQLGDQRFDQSREGRRTVSRSGDS